MLKLIHLTYENKKSQAKYYFLTYEIKMLKSVFLLLLGQDTTT